MDQRWSDRLVLDRGRKKAYIFATKIGSAKDDGPLAKYMWELEELCQSQPLDMLFHNLPP